MTSIHLTHKQEAFVQQYMIDHNATQAAIRAGYSPKNADVTGPRMLGNVGIQRRLAELERKAAAHAERTSNDVLARLAAIAWTDLTDIVDFDGQKMTFKSFEALTRAQKACIKEWKVKTVKKIELDENNKPVPVEVDMVEVKLHDKVKALELYAKHIGMDREAKKEALPIFNITMVTGDKKQEDKKPKALPPVIKASSPQ